MRVRGSICTVLQIVEKKLSFIILITMVIYLLLAKIYGLMMIVAVIIPVVLSRLLYRRAISMKSRRAYDI